MLVEVICNCCSLAQITEADELNEQTEEQTLQYGATNCYNLTSVILPDAIII